MATAKKKTTTAKNSSPAAKKSPANSTSAAAKRTATSAKRTVKTAAKKATIPKTAAAKAKATKAIPGDREQKLAEQALSLVDQAASVLRDRIRDGATQTAKGRLAAKKRANTLLSRASGNLHKAVDVGTDNLQKIFGK
ncbi:MAG: hypothetical protein WA771_15740 [Chthoniobacterales bacterium]